MTAPSDDHTRFSLAVAAAAAERAIADGDVKAAVAILYSRTAYAIGDDPSAGVCAQFLGLPASRTDAGSRALQRADRYVAGEVCRRTPVGSALYRRAVEVLRRTAKRRGKQFAG